MRLLLWICIALGALAVVWLGMRPFAARALSSDALTARYETPLAPPRGALSVYHLGHSLVGRDMPAMLMQLAGPEHHYSFQLGWGASLRNHWRDEVPGLAEENQSSRHMPPKSAIGSGHYRAVVLTEMVELRDAIRYHDSATYLARWAELAHAANATTRIYLYETWHRLDDPQGWEARIAADRTRLWEGTLLAGAMAEGDTGTIHVIPGGQVMAAVAAEIEAGRMPGLSSREDLFARSADGSVDPIHLNDIGAYVIALTHYAVLYHRSPLGLPHQLMRADGTPAVAPTEEAARKIQQVVWDVVTRYPLTGVAQSG